MQRSGLNINGLTLQKQPNHWALAQSPSQYSNSVTIPTFNIKKKLCVKSLCTSQTLGVFLKCDYGCGPKG